MHGPAANFLPTTPMWVVPSGGGVGGGAVSSTYRMLTSGGSGDGGGSVSFPMAQVGGFSGGGESVVSTLLLSASVPFMASTSFSHVSGGFQDWHMAPTTVQNNHDDDDLNLQIGIKDEDLSVRYA